mmetsp:Transcript_16976/g.27565  ORF Transcript_16976/g.27565 Transcript_16976/m.27565 type:complete len:139 (-) Transcript_16976:657-1073(-)
MANSFITKSPRVNLEERMDERRVLTKPNDWKSPWPRNPCNERNNNKEEQSAVNELRRMEYENKTKNAPSEYTYSTHTRNETTIPLYDMPLIILEHASYELRYSLWTIFSSKYSTINTENLQFFTATTFGIQCRRCLDL